jgi:hypothetical protein
MKLLPVLLIKFKKKSKDAADLIDIINEINNGSDLFWIIQNMELIGRFENTKYVNYAQKANPYNACCPILWKTMVEIAPYIDWVVWMDFIAFKNENKIRVYESDFELLKNCYIGIFRFDGEYWQIFTQDADLYKKILDKFEVFRTIPAEEFFRAT